MWQNRYIWYAMKHYKLLSALFAIMLSCDVLQAQLTIGEVFNLQVGDSLRYAEYRFAYLCHNSQKVYWIENKTSIKIVAKKAAGDTLMYVCRFDSWQPDTVLINNLDSPISTYKGILNPHYIQNDFLDAHVDTGATWYNDDTLHAIEGFISHTRLGMFFEYMHTVIHTKGMGIFMNEFEGRVDWPPSQFCGEGWGVRLIYYQSDSTYTTWQDTTSIYYLSVEEGKKATNFAIYPNPTRDVLYISTAETDRAPVEINVYDMLGTKLLSYKKQIQPNEPLDIALLEQGAYLLEINDGQTRAVKKFMVVR